MAIVLLVRNGIVMPNGPPDGMGRYHAGLSVRGDAARLDCVEHRDETPPILIGSGGAS